MGPKSFHDAISGRVLIVQLIFAWALKKVSSESFRLMSEWFRHMRLKLVFCKCCCEHRWRCVASNIELMNGLAPRYTESMPRFPVFYDMRKIYYNVGFTKRKQTITSWRPGLRANRSNTGKFNTRKGTTMIVAIVLYNFKLFYFNCVSSTKISIII